MNSEPVGSEWTALALRVSGGQPHRHHVLAVAAVHVAEGALVQTFHTYVKPPRALRVPRYTLDALGIDLDTLDDQPAFDEVLDLSLIHI